MLVMSGPGVRSEAPVHGAGLLDIAPTVLTLLGLPIGKDMDGRVLHEALDGAGTIERIESWDTLPGPDGMHPAEVRIEPFEALDALKQLEDLGDVAQESEASDPLVMCATETRFNLGVVLMTTGRPQPAAEVFARLYEEHPDERRFATNLANCWYTLGRHDDAVGVLNRLVAKFPDSPDSRLLQGSVLLAQGNFAAAATAMEEAIRRNPDRLDVLCALADAYTRLERWDDADRALGRASGIDPHNPMVPHRRALLALAQRRFEEAAEHALTALELRHFLPDVHHALGVALAWMHDYPHAIQSFQVALSMQPGYLSAHQFLASLHSHRGEHDKAAAHNAEADRLTSSRQHAPAQSQHSASPELTAPRPADPLGPEAWAQSLGSSHRD
jgi:tetratricopeptide (TPR) repeat protein